LRACVAPDNPSLRPKTKYWSAGSSAMCRVTTPAGIRQNAFTTARPIPRLHQMQHHLPSRRFDGYSPVNLSRLQHLGEHHAMRPSGGRHNQFGTGARAFDATNRFPLSSDFPSRTNFLREDSRSPGSVRKGFRDLRSRPVDASILPTRGIRPRLPALSFRRSNRCCGLALIARLVE
jgi:hypothetical protein